MKATMPIADNAANSQPLRGIHSRSFSPCRPCVSTRNALTKHPAKTPRQNTMVQESKASSRTNSGAVLQAMAAATTRTMPTLCAE
jgi:hypothetical protein